MQFGIHTFFLALALALVEGFEASMLAATNTKQMGTARTALVIAAGFFTAAAIGVGVYFLYDVISADIIDYAIAGFVFILGLNEVRKGLAERGSGGEDQSGEQQSDSQSQQDQQGQPGGFAWPAYFGMTLESTEVILYTLSVGHSSQSGYLAPGIGGAIGFVIPWLGMSFMQRVSESIPEWLQETTVGAVLITVAIIFTILRFFGLL